MAAKKRALVTDVPAVSTAVRCLTPFTVPFLAVSERLLTLGEQPHRNGASGKHFAWMFLYQIYDRLYRKNQNSAGQKSGAVLAFSDRVFEGK